MFVRNTLSAITGVTMYRYSAFNLLVFSSFMFAHYRTMQIIVVLSIQTGFFSIVSINQFARFESSLFGSFAIRQLNLNHFADI